MKKSGKLIAGLIIIIFVLAYFLPFESLAQTSTPNLKDAFGEDSTVEQVGKSVGYQTDDGEDKIFILIGQTINVIFSILGIIFVILTISAGYKWMTAGGNEEQVSAAKKSLKQSIIGLMVIVLTWGTWAIIRLLVNLF